ncbi:DNA mismatch repair protein MutS [Bosea sp. AS-1]|uniref:MutS-related protein n=1 Tax=Bosea sp. AS-1 TaxID=2015316 RepID=UPI0018E028D2|nr:DNA mismatch repair protein MutS [Bosea sp. AS-1]
MRLADRRPRPETTDRGVGAFTTILFPPGLETLRAERSEEPECFVDLNLDQVVASAVAKRDEDVLRPIFYSPCRNEGVVRYRQAVFADLERPEIFAIFPLFGDAMRSVHANLHYAGEISTRSHRNTVILRAAGLYCEAISAFLHNLTLLDLKSPGLSGLRSYLAGYTRSPAFVQLLSETESLRETLSGVSFGMLFSGDKVKVRKYASEPDYTTIILDRFAKFRESEIAPPSPSKPKDDFSLNHIEEGILEFVSRLFPEEFGSLDAYVARQGEFIDEVVARFGREIGFYVAYLDFIRPLRRAGLPFCHPAVSVSSKATEVTESFDLALATKIVAEKGTVVGNDFQLSGAERLLVVSGPNQGGKTTFARMFGQLHFLAGLGCPVPGKAAQLFLPDRIFTHFEREEDIENLRGKLEDELVRLHRSCRAMTGDSVIVLNEIFNSTSLEDQVFLSTQVLERILAVDAIGVCVTFLDALSTLSEKTVSMVSTVDPDEPARRTFRIIRKPADGLAYALSLAEKRGVTYAKLRTRVRP